MFTIVLANTVKQQAEKMGIGYTLKISPQVEKTRKHVEKLEGIINKNVALSQIALISLLNPVIRGWTNYYRALDANRAFGYGDHMLFWALYKWGLKRHRNKGKIWVAQRYFYNEIKQNKKDPDSYRTKKWVFAVKHENVLKYKLRYHVEQLYKRSYQIKQDFSPYHPEYYQKQVENYQCAFKSKLFKRQEGICRVCNGPILPDDLVEVHHLIPKGVPERNKLKMIWLIHGHCHDRVHSREGIELSIVEEEPYDA